jgi:pyruvate-formate lyase-activating enzyme
MTHKLTDPVRQKKWTGADNKRILANYKKAYETYPDKAFIARTPLVPGANDDEGHIRAVLAFIRPHKNWFVASIRESPPELELCRFSNMGACDEHFHSL